MSLFSWLKRNKIPSAPEGYFPIQTDIHSHILPGIDDGSPDLETSIHLIQGLKQLGIHHSIATPHIISDLYRNTPETISKAHKLLQDELHFRQIDFKVEYAAEYMMDTYFMDLVKNKSPLLTIKGNIILTEFSFAFMPDNIERMAFEIQVAGYKPILAHPERYSYFYRDYKIYHRLSELGFLFQVNLLSLTGAYGKDAVKVAEYLLKNGMVSYLGTDLHHDRHMQMLSDSRTTDIFHLHLSDRYWNDFSLI
jgi:protein-tyrosine phosphatase